MAKELFYKYLKEKNIQEPHDKKELAQVLKSFMWKHDNAFVVIFLKTMYNKTIIRFGFFVISRIIKVSVSVINLNLRLRLITLTSTLIILDITNTSSNNCFKLRKKAKISFSFAFSPLGKTRARKEEVKIFMADKKRS